MRSAWFKGHGATAVRQLDYAFCSGGACEQVRVGELNGIGIGNRGAGRCQVQMWAMSFIGPILLVYLRRSYPLDIKEGLLAQFGDSD